MSLICADPEHTAMAADGKVFADLSTDEKLALHRVLNSAGVSLLRRTRAQAFTGFHGELQAIRWPLRHDLITELPHRLYAAGGEDPYAAMYAPHGIAELARQPENVDTAECRHCGKAIRRNAKGIWGARKRDDPHPWYCDASPDTAKRHEPDSPAGLTPFTVTRDDQLCSGGREEIPAGATAYQDEAGWVVCALHSSEWAARAQDDGGSNPYDMWSETPDGWDAFTDETEGHS
jgi:hypothetical protein